MLAQPCLRTPDPVGIETLHRIMAACNGVMPISLSIGETE